MRKFIVGSLLASAIGGGSLAAVAAATAGSAGATPTCYSGGTPVALGAPLGTITVNPGKGGTSGAIQVCSQGSSVINGTVTASGNAAPPGGYLVANGDSASNPHGPTGYIGVEGGTGGVAVVGCSTGDYTTGHGPNPNDTDDQTSTGNNDGYTQPGYDSGGSTDSDADGAASPPPNDGTTDANGNNVILNSSGNGSAKNPASLVTGSNCGLANQPKP